MAFIVRSYRLLLLPAFFALAACKHTGSPMAKTDPLPVIVQEPLTVPVDTSQVWFTGLKAKAAVVKYYQESGSDPLWIKEERFTALADSMMSMIRSVQYYGLPTGSYHLAELENLSGDFSRAALIRKELLLTDAFLTFSIHLRYGVQRSAGTLIDTLQLGVLRNVVQRGGLVPALESQEPRFKGYVALKQGMRFVLDSMKLTKGPDSLSFLEKVKLISINMERWRVEASMPGRRYIFINIPSYQLVLVEDDSVVFSSKVIVGTPQSETPIISSTVDCFTIYPYWHVPRKIAIEEYLPRIKRDTSIITRNNFDVLDRKGNVLDPDSVEWSRFHKNYFPVVLRQREGPENSLGIIKFVFDNPYAVFLHDTNAKRLFRRDERAFSHGCIRMEKAVELAHLLVTGVAGSESKLINKYLKEKKRYWVELKRTIPIYTRYFTCEFNDNRLLIYKDIYHKDNVLYELLYGESNIPDL